MNWNKTSGWAHFPCNSLHFLLVWITWLCVTNTVKNFYSKKFTYFRNILNISYCNFVHAFKILCYDSYSVIWIFFFGDLIGYEKMSEDNFIKSYSVYCFFFIRIQHIQYRNDLYSENCDTCCYVPFLISLPSHCMMHHGGRNSIWLSF